MPDSLAALDDQPNLAIDYNNLSQIYKARGDLGEAELWLGKAIEIAERFNDTLTLRTLYKNAQLLNVEAGQDDEARIFAEKLALLNFPSRSTGLSASQT